MCSQKNPCTASQMCVDQCDGTPACKARSGMHYYVDKKNKKI